MANVGQGALLCVLWLLVAALLHSTVAHAFHHNADTIEDYLRVGIEEVRHFDTPGATSLTLGWPLAFHSLDLGEQLYPNASSDSASRILLKGSPRADHLHLDMAGDFYPLRSAAFAGGSAPVGEADRFSLSGVPPRASVVLCHFNSTFGALDVSSDPFASDMVMEALPLAGASRFFFSSDRLGVLNASGAAEELVIDLSHHETLSGTVTLGADVVTRTRSDGTTVESEILVIESEDGHFTRSEFQFESLERFLLRGGPGRDLLVVRRLPTWFGASLAIEGSLEEDEIVLEEDLNPTGSGSSFSAHQMTVRAAPCPVSIVTPGIVNINSNCVCTGADSISISAGDVSSTALIQTENGNIVIDTTATISLAGNVASTGTGDITLIAGSVLTQAGTISAATGAISLSGTSIFQNGGTLRTSSGPKTVSVVTDLLVVTASAFYDVMADVVWDVTNPPAAGTLINSQASSLSITGDFSVNTVGGDVGASFHSSSLSIGGAFTVSSTQAKSTAVSLTSLIAASFTGAVMISGHVMVPSPGDPGTGVLIRSASSFSCLSDIVIDGDVQGGGSDVGVSLESLTVTSFTSLQVSGSVGDQAAAAGPSIGVDVNTWISTGGPVSMAGLVVSTSSASPSKGINGMSATITNEISLSGSVSAPDFVLIFWRSSTFSSSAPILFAGTASSTASGVGTGLDLALITFVASEARFHLTIPGTPSWVGDGIVIHGSTITTSDLVEFISGSPIDAGSGADGTAVSLSEVTISAGDTVTISGYAEPGDGTVGVNILDSGVNDCTALTVMGVCQGQGNGAIGVLVSDFNVADADVQCVVSITGTGGVATSPTASNHGVQFTGSSNGFLCQAISVDGTSLDTPGSHGVYISDPVTLQQDTTASISGECHMASNPSGGSAFCNGIFVESVLTLNGDTTLVGTSRGLFTTNASHGVQLKEELVVSAAAAVTVTGTANDANSSCLGVDLNCEVTFSVSGATFTVAGHGSSDGVRVAGVWDAAVGFITISITGTGGQGPAASSRGVVFVSNNFGGAVVSVTGTGGSSVTDNNYGIFIPSGANLNAELFSLTGTGGMALGRGNHGIMVAGSIEQFDTTTLTLVGDYGQGENCIGVLVDTTANMAHNSGNVVITGGAGSTTGISAVTGVELRGIVAASGDLTISTPSESSVYNDVGVKIGAAVLAAGGTISIAGEAKFTGTSVGVLVSAVAHYEEANQLILTGSGRTGISVVADVIPSQPMSVTLTGTGTGTSSTDGVRVTSAEVSSDISVSMDGSTSNSTCSSECVGVRLNSATVAAGDSCSVTGGVFGPGAGVHLTGSTLDVCTIEGNGNGQDTCVGCHGVFLGDSNTITGSTSITGTASPGGTASSSHGVVFDGDLTVGPSVILTVRGTRTGVGDNSHGIVVEGGLWSLDSSTVTATGSSECASTCSGVSIETGFGGSACTLGGCLVNIAGAYTGPVCGSCYGVIVSELAVTFGSQAQLSGTSSLGTGLALVSSSVSTTGSSALLLQGSGADVDVYFSASVAQQLGTGDLTVNAVQSSTIVIDGDFVHAVGKTGGSILFSGETAVNSGVLSFPGGAYDLAFSASVSLVTSDFIVSCDELTLTNGLSAQDTSAIGVVTSSVTTVTLSSDASGFDLDLQFCPLLFQGDCVLQTALSATGEDVSTTMTFGKIDGPFDVEFGGNGFLLSFQEPVGGTSRLQSVLVNGDVGHLTFGNDATGVMTNLNQQFSCDMTLENIGGSVRDLTLTTMDPASQLILDGGIADQGTTGVRLLLRSPFTEIRDQVYEVDGDIEIQGSGVAVVAGDFTETILRFANSVTISVAASGTYSTINCVDSSTLHVEGALLGCIAAARIDMDDTSTIVLDMDSGDPTPCTGHDSVSVTTLNISTNAELDLTGSLSTPEDYVLFDSLGGIPSGVFKDKGDGETFLFGGISSRLLYSATEVILRTGQAPIAFNDTYIVAVGEFVLSAPGVLTNDFDPDGGTIAAVLQTGPSMQTSFTLSSNGSFTYNRESNPGAYTDFFTYFAVDSDGILSELPATVTLNVLALPSPTPTSSSTPTQTSTSTDTPSTTRTAPPTASSTMTLTSTPSTTTTRTATPTTSSTGTLSSTPSTTTTRTATPTMSSTPSTTTTRTPTRTRTPSTTGTGTATNTPSNTASETATRTSTPTRTATSSNTGTATGTATSSNTATQTQTQTPSESGTASPSVTPSSSQSGTATQTSSSTMTGTGTASTTPSASKLASLSNTPTPAKTSSTSSTRTSTTTSTGTPTSTQSSSSTSTFSTLPSVTPTGTSTATGTGTASNTPTGTGTPTQSGTATGTPSRTATNSAASTTTKTRSATPSSSSSVTPSSTESKSVTPSSTESRSVTPSNTASSSVTVTPTSTTTESSSASTTTTPSATTTNSASVSPQQTPTKSAVQSSSSSSSPSPLEPTPSSSPSLTLSPSSSRTRSHSRTSSRSDSRTATPTKTSSPSPPGKTVSPTSSQVPFFLPSQLPTIAVTALPPVAPSVSPVGASPSVSASRTGSTFTLALPSRSCAFQCVDETAAFVQPGTFEVPITARGEDVGTFTIQQTQEIAEVLVVGPGTAAAEAAIIGLNVGSPVVDLVLLDASGQVVQPDGDVTVCLEVDDPERAEDEGCLSFFDEEANEWVCEDPCLEISGDTVCGDSSHLTNFAILLDGGDGGGNGCDSDDDGAYIFDEGWKDAILLLSVTGACFVLVVLILLAFVLVPGLDRIHGREYMRVNSVREAGTKVYGSTNASASIAVHSSL